MSTEDPLQGLTPLELAAKSIKAREIDWLVFTRMPLEDFYFQAWRLYFNMMLRDDISDAAASALLKELRNRRFTNGDLTAAGDAILLKARRWPHLADFMQHKDESVPSDD